MASVQVVRLVGVSWFSQISDVGYRLVRAGSILVVRPVREPQGATMVAEQ